MSEPIATTEAQVPVILADGQRGTVPASQVANLAQYGARLESAEPTATPTTATDVLHGVAAGTLGLARGATMGGTDEDVLKAAYAIGGPEMRHEYAAKLEALKKESPYISGATEVAGAILPGLATGGAATAKAALPLAERGLAEAAPSLLREAAPVVERAAPAIAEAAAPAVEQGVARGLTSGIANAAPTELTSALGGLVEKGVIKSLGGEGQSLLGKVVKGTLSGGARGAVEGAIYGGTDELNEERLGDAGLNGEKLLAAMGHGALFGAATGGVLMGASPLVRHAGNELISKVDGLAGEQAFRALSPHPKAALTKMAENIPGGASAVGDKLLEMKLMRMGDTTESVLARITPAKEDVGLKLAALRDALDKEGVAGPVIQKIFDSFDTKVTNKLDVLPSLNKGAIDTIEALRNDIASYAVDGKLTFTKAQEIRSRLDDSIRFTAPAPGAPKNAVNDALHNMRSSFEGEVESAVERGSKKMGPEYKELKDTYRKLSLAEDVAEDGVAKTLKNRKVSPTDYLVGAAELAAGNPLSAIALAGAHHILRERGNSTAAVLLDKIGSLGLIKNAAMRVDRNIARGVAQTFGQKVADVAVKEARHPGPEGHAERIKDVIRTVSEDHRAGIEQSVAPIAEHAPQTARAFQSAAIRASTYLRSLLPKDTQGPGLQPHLRNVADEMSNTEQAKFERAYHMCNDPVGVSMTRLKDGTIVSDEVDCLKTVHPEIYGQMTDEIANRLATSKKPLPSETRAALATFLDDPAIAGPTYSPEYLIAMGNAYQGQPKPGGGGKTGGSHKQPKLDDLTGISHRDDLSNVPDIK